MSNKIYEYQPDFLSKENTESFLLRVLTDFPKAIINKDSTLELEKLITICNKLAKIYDFKQTDFKDFKITLTHNKARIIKAIVSVKNPLIMKKMLKITSSFLEDIGHNFKSEDINGAVSKLHPLLLEDPDIFNDIKTLIEFDEKKFFFAFCEHIGSNKNKHNFDIKKQIMHAKNLLKTLNIEKINPIKNQATENKKYPGYEGALHHFFYRIGGLYINKEIVEFIEFLIQKGDKIDSNLFHHIGHNYSTITDGKERTVLTKLCNILVDNYNPKTFTCGDKKNDAKRICYLLSGFNKRNPEQMEFILKKMEQLFEKDPELEPLVDLFILSGLRILPPRKIKNINRYQESGDPVFFKVIDTCYQKNNSILDIQYLIALLKINDVKYNLTNKEGDTLFKSIEKNINMLINDSSGEDNAALSNLQELQKFLEWEMLNIESTSEFNL